MVDVSDDVGLARILKGPTVAVIHDGRIIWLHPGSSGARPALPYETICILGKALGDARFGAKCAIIDGVPSGPVQFGPVTITQEMVTAAGEEYRVRSGLSDDLAESDAVAILLRMVAASGLMPKE